MDKIFLISEKNKLNFIIFICASVISSLIFFIPLHYFIFSIILFIFFIIFNLKLFNKSYNEITHRYTGGSNTIDFVRKKENEDYTVFSIVRRSSRDVIFNDNINVKNNKKVYFGKSNNAAIWYDGTNLHIDARLVGSGNIILDNIPASNPVLKGALYKNNETLKISSG